jgi:hypothetical protein
VVVPQPVLALQVTFPLSRGFAFPLNIPFSAVIVAVNVTGVA